jgi:hypothetical protein
MMKISQIYLFAICTFFLVALGILSTGCPSPKKTCKDCVAPDTVMAVSPLLHPDSLYIKWDTVPAANNYHVKVTKVTPLLVIKDTIVPASSQGKLNLGGMPTGASLKVAVSAMCKIGELNCESTPTMAELVSSDGGVIIMEENLDIMSVFSTCLATCDNQPLLSGTFSSDTRGAAPMITWDACTDNNLNYYLIVMRPTRGACAPMYLKNVYQNELNYTPCGLCFSADFKYEVYGLVSLSPCLDMARVRVSNCP